VLEHASGETLEILIRIVEVYPASVSIRGSVISISSFMRGLRAFIFDPLPYLMLRTHIPSVAKTFYLSITWRTTEREEAQPWRRYGGAAFVWMQRAKATLNSRSLTSRTER
jgi:hypothetical protein